MDILYPTSVSWTGRPRLLRHSPFGWRLRGDFRQVRIRSSHRPPVAV